MAAPQDRMRILFIKLRHIGDSLLLTPTLVATKQKFPQAEIWVLVRKSCDGILAGCPEIDRILTTANPDSSKRGASDWLADLKLAALLRKTRFDFVFELTDNDRARLFAIAARTPSRCTNKHPSLRWFWRPFFHHVCEANRRREHQVVRDYVCPREVLELPSDPPALRFAAESMCEIVNLQNWTDSRFCVIHIHTRWTRKSWPIKRWELLIESLLEFVPRIILSCGPDPSEVEENNRLCERFGARVFSTDGHASWSQLGWLLQNASFFVGVDTAAMHLAAAFQCPTVALFGPSPIHEYHPWKTKSWVIRPQNWLGEEEAKSIPRDFLMREIPVNRVLDACREAFVPNRLASA